MSAQQLQAVFRELDYLDDGYEDGLVSHVGLRRIILETPELEVRQRVVVVGKIVTIGFSSQPR